MNGKSVGDAVWDSLFIFIYLVVFGMGCSLGSFKCGSLTFPIPLVHLGAVDSDAIG